MERLKDLVEAFKQEVVPDLGLGALLATPEEVEAFNVCKERLCAFQVDTLSQWLDGLVSELKGLSRLANESLVGYLLRHIPAECLRQQGLYVNPTEQLLIQQQGAFDMRCVLVSDEGQDVKVKYIRETDEPAHIKVAAHPRHQVVVTAERVGVVAYGETRLEANTGGQVWAHDFSQVRTEALLVHQDRFSTVCAQRASKADSLEGYYWATYASFGVEDPRYGVVERQLAEHDYYGLLCICKDVREACGVYPMSTVTDVPQGFVLAYDQGLALGYEPRQERVYVQARLTEQELMREIWRHGMPADASPCLLALPKQERLRTFIRDYREQGLRALSLNGEDGYLRYDKRSDTMQVVRPRCGGVIAAVPYVRGCSMSENIRLAAEQWCGKVSEGERLTTGMRR